MKRMRPKYWTGILIIGATMISAAPVSALNWNFSVVTTGGNVTGTFVTNGTTATTGTTYTISSITGTAGFPNSAITALRTNYNADNTFRWGGAGTNTLLTTERGFSYLKANGQYENISTRAANDTTVSGTTYAATSRRHRGDGTNFSQNDGVTSATVTPQEVPFEINVLPVAGIGLPLWAVTRFLKTKRMRKMKLR